MFKKTVIAAVLIGAVVALTACGQENKTASKPTYPEKPIVYVVQASGGGSSDVFVRKIGQIMKDNKIMPQPFVVQPMPGGGGATAYNYVKKEAGNPYVIANTTTVFIGTGLYTKNWTPDDFTPIARLAVEPPCVVVDAKLPYNTLKDLVEDAKARPGAIKWAGGQTGTKNQVLSALLGKASGAQFSYVPFQGDNEALAAVLGGHVQVATCNGRDIAQHYKAKTIKILGVSGEKRMEMLPEVPTIREAGYDVVLYEPRGVVAPKNIPPEAEKYLEEAFAKMVKTKDWQKYLRETSLEDGYLPAKQYKEWLNQENEMWKKMLTELGFLK